VLVLLLRFFFVVLAVLIGMTSGQYFYRALTEETFPPWLGGAMGFGIAVTLIAAEHAFRRRFTRSLVAFLIGLAGGLLLSFLLLAVLKLVLQDDELYRNLDLPLALVTTYLVVITVLRGADRFRLVLPFVEFQHQRTDTGALVLDLAALGDGRVPALVRAGVLDQRLLVHRRVLAAAEELIAAPDAAQQARGRRALDGLAQLRGLGRPLTIDETEIPNAASLADVLIGLTRLEGGRLIAGDHELARRAQAEGAAVIDLAELAAAANPGVRPGDVIHVAIEKVGEGKRQGVGHLDDGSLVVVNEADDKVGTRVKCTVLRLHNTAQGRMVFAELSG